MPKSKDKKDKAKAAEDQDERTGTSAAASMATSAAPSAGMETPPLPSAEAWSLLWARLTREQRALLTLENSQTESGGNAPKDGDAINFATLSGGLPHGPQLTSVVVSSVPALAAPKSEPLAAGRAIVTAAGTSASASGSAPLVVENPRYASAGNHEREAERLWTALRESDLVRDVHLDGMDASVAFRRDRALVLLVRELEHRASDDAVRCLLWKRLLQTAPMFQVEAQAVATIGFSKSATARYQRVRELLAVDKRCYAVVNESIARVSAPRQLAREPVEVYVRRIALEIEMANELLELLPNCSSADTARVVAPGGSTLFKGLTAATRAAVESDRKRIFEMAAIAADRAAGSTTAGDRLRAAAAMVVDHDASAETALALVGFADAALVLKRVSGVTEHSTRSGSAGAVGAAVMSALSVDTAAVEQGVQGKPQSSRPPTDLSQVRCFKCQQFGHIARRCRNEPKKKSTSEQPSPTQPVSKPPAKPALRQAVGAVATGGLNPDADVGTPAPGNA